MNLFRYCGDDPVNRSDPMGLHDLGDDWETAAWNQANYGIDGRGTKRLGQGIWYFCQNGCVPPK
jgi:hypothetical protein